MKTALSCFTTPGRLLRTCLSIGDTCCSDPSLRVTSIQKKHDEIKRAKTVIEGNVQKILQALGDDNNDGKEQVVNLVEDFHKHYQSLYERYDHLTEELRKKADGKHGKDSSLSRSDSSDSAWEYQTALGEPQEAQKLEYRNWNTDF